MERKRFRPDQRLRSGAQFSHVYQQGRRLGNELFSANVCANDLPQARLGLSVAVRAAGSAVLRNRWRRMIRDSFRLHQALLPGVDIVVGTRPLLRKADNAAIHASLQRLWNKIANECAR
ncbi:MAG: ribonuclease P protein component [Steroidobacteraceae bacterium]